MILHYNLYNTFHDSTKVQNNLTGSTIITLLPGSRLQEVTRMLPIFLNAMTLLKESFPKLIAVVPVAPDCHVQAYIAKTLKKWSIPAILIPGTSINDKYDAFSVCIILFSLFDHIYYKLYEFEGTRLKHVVSKSHKFKNLAMCRM